MSILCKMTSHDVVKCAGQIVVDQWLESWLEFPSVIGEHISIVPLKRQEATLQEDYFGEESSSKL
jgi:hypothetical protein